MPSPLGYKPLGYILFGPQCLFHWAYIPFGPQTTSFPLGLCLNIEHSLTLTY